MATETILLQALAELEDCKFKCTAGDLVNHVAWSKIKAIAYGNAPLITPHYHVAGEGDTCAACGHDLRSIVHLSSTPGHPLYTAPARNGESSQ